MTQGVRTGNQKEKEQTKKLFIAMELMAICQEPWKELELLNSPKIH